jgi:hypothetical protein
MATYIDFIASRLPAKPWKGPLGERFVGLVGGMFGNLIAEGASLAIEAFWLIAGQPPDVLTYQGGDKRLRKYLAETFDQYRARLERAVEIWEIGGTEECTEDELTSAGYVGASVRSPLNWTRTPLNWWSEFWIFLPFSSHADGSPVTLCGSGALCGSGVLAGDGTPFGPPPRCGTTGSIVGQVMCGISGPIERVTELRYIAKNFKAGENVCRQIIVEIDAPTCGVGLLAGASHLCGGTQSYIGTGVIEE